MEIVTRDIIDVKDQIIKDKGILTKIVVLTADLFQQ